MNAFDEAFAAWGTFKVIEGKLPEAKLEKVYEYLGMSPPMIQFCPFVMEAIVDALLEKVEAESKPLTTDT